nr:uncharacterized protein LOC109620796 [Crassostrea gigas]
MTSPVAKYNTTQRSSEKGRSLNICAKMENRRGIVLGNIHVELLKRLSRENPKMARKIMHIILDHHKIKTKLHRELLTAVKERSVVEQRDGPVDAFFKLRESNENRMKAVRDTMLKEKRDRLLKDVFVQLVRKIRARRNPDVAKRITIMLQENHVNLMLIQKELLMKVKEKEEKCRAKKEIQEELLTKINERKVYVQIRRLGYTDLMTCQLEKHVEDGDFLPRGLFMFGVDTFKCTAKPENELNVQEHERNIKLDDGNQSQSPLVTCATDVTRESVLTSNNKAKTSQRLSFANRVRRFFGLR